ncbi:juvenile hormone acid O-methyltransferase-like [Stomoxys calcitrans]|uniref:juvenile hormone acid O-methyltransferase-like n=1 Tax=Stomoxys calcitrans TaxID=35570 RepID=UPI0027E34783|nr:juvenile hormone acid O-methyltransferase-like [Stomoxys calcitrans]
MNLPALYHKSHLDLKKDVGQIIREYSSKWRWRLDGADTLIDVGSGPGDVLIDHIYPLMPTNFTKIIGSDISADMVDYAQKFYHFVEKCEFLTLDIGSPKPLPEGLQGQFDHVTSMLCLHWVQNHRLALNNIFKLLRPSGGDCFIIFMSSHTIFDAYLHINKDPKWSPYITTDVLRFVSPLHDCDQTKAVFTQMMEDAGFCNVEVDVRPRTINFGTVEYFKENVKSVCGLIDYIPKSKQDEFMDDFVAIMSEYAAKGGDFNDSQSKSSMKYDLLVAYGRKPDTRGESRSL